MGGTWEIFWRICLLCGRNLPSGHIAKCDPKFSSPKNFENRKIHQRRRNAWVGQADFGKLQLNNRNHGGNCQRLSGKRDQFETRSIWRPLKQSQKFSEVRTFVNGLGCYYSSPFQRFYENSIQASNSQAYNPSPFQRFYGNSFKASHLQLPRQVQSDACYSPG